jgi:hypothetical protein
MEEQTTHVIAAIHRLQEQVRWKPGKAEQHLQKRIALGHLPVGTTEAVYEALILRVIRTPTAEVLVYHWGESMYPTVVSDIDGSLWLVMLDLDGVMETAFPPEDPDTYLANPQFLRLGTLEEINR